MEPTRGSEASTKEGNETNPGKRLLEYQKAIEAWFASCSSCHEEGNAYVMLMNL
jgi:hypothetical protein